MDSSNSNAAGTQNFINYNKTSKQDNNYDIEKLIKQKESAEKDAQYFKEHYYKVKNDMDDLFKMFKESSQNKKDLTNIIEEKNKIISELKSNTNSECLSEEIHNATEKLADEKKQNLKLQAKLNEVTIAMNNSHSEKLKLIKKLEQGQVDMKKYDNLQERLTLMVEKQGNLEKLFKRNKEALHISNTQRDEFQCELIKARQFIQGELLKLQSEKVNYDSIKLKYENELKTVKEELEICKMRNEDLLKLKFENPELRQKLTIIADRTNLNANNIVESVPNSSKNSIHEAQVKISELSDVIENYKSENLKLNNDVAELNKQVLNNETIFRELKNELEEKEVSLKVKMRDIEELQKKICRVSDDNKTMEQSLRNRLQEEFFDKMRIMTDSSEEKEKKLLEQLNDTKMELHKCVGKQHAIIAENSAQVTDLESKIIMQEQEIIKIESEKFVLQENIKHLSMNKKSFDSNIDTIKNQLIKVTQERDEKSKVILSLRKMSQQMQSFADESRDETKQIYMESDSLRKKAYEAQSRLEALMSEQESQKNEIEILQQKLVEMDRNYSQEKAKLKKNESQLKQELAETQSQFTASAVEKNKIFYEKEMALKNLKECEKCLANTNNELGVRNSEIQKLQREQDKLHSKLLEYRDKITQFDKETDKLMQEKQNLSQNILILEKSVQNLEKEVTSKSETITELSCNNEILKAKNTELQQIENEFNELRTLKKQLSKQNSELKEKCNLLDDDLDTLRYELKIEQKNIKEMQVKNESLETSLQKSYDNSLLQKTAEEYRNLEKEKDVISNKYNSLVVNCDKLDVELGVVRKELIQSREKQSRLEEVVRTLKNSEVDWREKCSNLAVKNDNLAREFSQKQVKLTEEIEILRNKEILITSENEKLCKENIDANKLILDRELKFNDLQTINAEIIKKCCDFDSKELFYEEEIRKRAEELALNIAENASLRSKYDVLGPKLTKYVTQYKILKQKNTELHEIINKANESSTNYEKEAADMKKYCQNIEIELSKLKSENDKLKEEINLIKRKSEIFQQKQESSHKLQAGVKSTSSKIKRPISEDDPLYHLDTLVGQVRQSSSPAAQHLLKSCNHIKDLIIRERGDVFKQ